MPARERIDFNMIRYRMKYRPAGFATLPRGLVWSYVEAPVMHGLANRPDLPRSRYQFGVFTTNRPLTDRELEAFEIEIVPETTEP